MERITKSGYKFNLLNVLQGLNRYADVDEILNRLAAYEDTGLEPEEINEALREKQEREKNERIQYNRLMHLASEMHLYIFLHTGDEQGAYDEIGLTGEENAILGYSGEFELRPEGSDNDA